MIPKAPNLGGICMSSDGNHIDVSLEGLLANDQWMQSLVIFFYPMHFGYISASKLLELSNVNDQF